MDLIRTGQIWEATKRKEYRSSPVTLRRDGQDTAGVLAVIGSTSAAMDDAGSGVLFEVKVRDYVIDVADYQFAASVVFPKAGDLIIETVNGVEEAFQVLPQPGQPEKNWSDQFGIAWRIHTKYHGPVPVVVPEVPAIAFGDLAGVAYGFGGVAYGGREP